MLKDKKKNSDIEAPNAELIIKQKQTWNVGKDIRDDPQHLELMRLFSGKNTACSPTKQVISLAHDNQSIYCHVWT